jgi:hypothetical protein
MNISPSFRILRGMGVESLWNPQGMRGESTSNVSTANLQPKKKFQKVQIPCGFHMDSTDSARNPQGKGGECKVLGFLVKLQIFVRAWQDAAQEMPPS